MTPEQSRILVVDDDDFVRDMLVARLEFRGYQVIFAKNGREALDMCKQGEPDVILLDIMMPEINGIQVLQQLRAADLDIPVVVMSALDDMGSVVQCIELGAEDYLYKPIQSQLLWARLTASLEKKYYRDREQQHLADLKLLQQIDRALNQTLDRQEVARLTLYWAVEQTKAADGIMGSLRNKELLLRATHGVDLPLESTLSLEELGIDASSSLDLTQETVAPKFRFHAEATHRIIFAIYRDEVALDLVLLEVTKPCTAETLDFLGRLSTHAAIALHNAQLYADVQAANLAKSSFVAMVSHELKNPLVAILSYSDLLRRGVGGAVSAKQNELLHVIRSSAERIHTLAQELDDITRMEMGHFNLKVTAVSFKPTLDEVLGILSQQIEAKQQVVHLELPDVLPPVYADAQRVSQILTNLISNASKYSPSGKEIVVRVQEVADAASPMLQVFVKDSGIGIATNEQSAVFSQFFRAEDRQVRAERGTGLGLHITKKLVELQGGQIGFTSEYGKGSTFFFSLPVCLEETAVPKRA
ncbi:MAG: response regulator [Anaerolineales bacterium]|nr:response regulator [Anaerolineales bacterium]